MRTSFVAALVVLLATSVAVAGCGRPGANADGVAVAWQTHPDAVTVDQPALIEINLHDPAQQPVERATLRIEAHMQHPGMAPVIEPAEARGNGVYSAHLRFSMAGEWIVIVSGELPDGRRIRRQLGEVTARPAG